MKEFVFGNDNGYDKSCAIKADTVEIAIKVFKIQELFPEKFVDAKQIKTRGWDRKGTIYGEKDYVFTVPDPEISVFEWNLEKHKGKLVKKIHLSECVNADFAQLIPKSDKALLPASTTPSEDIEESTALEVKEKHEISRYTKVQLRDKTQELELKKQELEMMVREVHRQMEVIQKELKEKIKILLFLETYLGTREEIVTIVEGEKAPENEPLTVYQQTLYMDEEIGIWENGGIDFQDIKKFDVWLSKNYEKFLYKPKSVCAFRVRRNDKHYDDNVLVNCMMNESNHKTYFFIRNGENLYRIWSDIFIGERLFPTKTEYDDYIAKGGSCGEDRMMEKLKDKHFQYLYGLVAIQGLIERTDILGFGLKGKVNLLTGKFTDEHVRLIRDDETGNWLGDGNPSWDDFMKANTKTIGVGTRVVLSGSLSSNYKERKEDNWRYSSSRAPAPSMNEIYIIEEERDKNDKVTYFSYHTWKFVFKYKPCDEIYSNKYWEDPHARKRAVSCKVYESEILNYDDITLEDVDHYLKNRIERKHYLRMLPILINIRKLKLQEKALEDEFIKLILGKMGWGDNDKSKVEGAIEWWKLKNKWKRGLMTDDAKAVRMILAKLKSGNPIEYEIPTVKWVKYGLWECRCFGEDHETVRTNGDETPKTKTCKKDRPWEFLGAHHEAVQGEPKKIKILLDK